VAEGEPPSLVREPLDEDREERKEEKHREK
jgi:hypothetical protein